MKKILFITLVMTLVSISLISIFFIYKDKKEDYEQEKVFEEIKDVVNQSEEKEEENEEFIKYTFYELRVKYNLTEQEVNQVLKISKDYFQNKGYKIYFTGARFEYKNANRMVQDNELMIAIRE